MNEQRIKFHQHRISIIKEKLAQYGLTLDDDAILCDLALAGRLSTEPVKGEEYRSRYKGLCWIPHQGRFKVTVYKDCKLYCAGYFNKEEDALTAYKKKYKEVYDE